MTTDAQIAALARRYVAALDAIYAWQDDAERECHNAHKRETFQLKRARDCMLEERHALWALQEAVRGPRR